MARKGIGYINFKSLTLDVNYRMDTTTKQADSANLEQYLDQNEGFFELTPQPQSTATSPGELLTATMVHLNVSEQTARSTQHTLSAWWNGRSATDRLRDSASRYLRRS